MIKWDVKDRDQKKRGDARSRDTGRDGAGHGTKGATGHGVIIIRRTCSISVLAVKKKEIAAGRTRKKRKKKRAQRAGKKRGPARWA